MPKPYEVRLTREALQVVVVEVYAENPEEAEKLARALTQYAPEAADYEMGEAVAHDPNVIGIVASRWEGFEVNEPDLWTMTACDDEDEREEEYEGGTDA